MKKVFLLFLLFAFAICCMPALSQAQTLTKELPPFEKIMVSPLVNLVLEEGENEHIRLEYSGVEPEKINVVVSGKKLKIYLDGAKIRVKHKKYYDDEWEYSRPVYEGVSITAYVTYRKLRSMEVRGEERTVCLSPVVAGNFRLQIFGESQVTLTSLETSHLKAALYGQNTLTIKAGSAGSQQYRVYGENEIDTKKLLSKNISTSSFGESRLNLHASESLKVTALGESSIYYSGNAQLNKKLIIGTTTIRELSSLDK